MLVSFTLWTQKETYTWGGPSSSLLLSSFSSTLTPPPLSVWAMALLFVDVFYDDAFYDA
jgi:hypothetical protein